MSDEFADWFAAPYARQLRRQVLDLLRSDPHGVIDTAQRILSTTDEGAVRHLSEHVSGKDDPVEQAQHIGQVARIAYLTCIVMLMDAATDEGSEFPEWLREIGRRMLGRGTDGLDRRSSN